MFYIQLGCFLIKLFINKILMAAYLFNFSCLPELETKGMVHIKSQAIFLQLGTTNLWFWHGMMFSFPLTHLPLSHP